MNEAFTYAKVMQIDEIPVAPPRAVRILDARSKGEEDPVADGEDKLIWRKSRSCATNACVEVARSGADFVVRDSNEPDGHRLAFGPEEWAAFITVLRRGGLALNPAERD